MSGTMKRQTGPLSPQPPQFETTLTPPQAERIDCPVCGDQVTYRVEYGAVLLDWHRNRSNSYATCNGSDYNMSEDVQ